MGSNNSKKVFPRNESSMSNPRTPSVVLDEDKAKFILTPRNPIKTSELFPPKVSRKHISANDRLIYCLLKFKKPELKQILKHWNAQDLEMRNILHYVGIIFNYISEECLEYVMDIMNDMFIQNYKDLSSQMHQKSFLSLQWSKFLFQKDRYGYCPMHVMFYHVDSSENLYIMLKKLIAYNVFNREEFKIGILLAADPIGTDHFRKLILTSQQVEVDCQFRWYYKPWGGIRKQKRSVFMEHFQNFKTILVEYVMIEKKRKRKKVLSQRVKREHAELILQILDCFLIDYFHEPLFKACSENDLDLVKSILNEATQQHNQCSVHNRKTFIIHPKIIVESLKIALFYQYQDIISELLAYEPIISAVFPLKQIYEEVNSLFEDNAAEQTNSKHDATEQSNSNHDAAEQKDSKPVDSKQIDSLKDDSEMNSKPVDSKQIDSSQDNSKQSHSTLNTLLDDDIENSPGKLERFKKLTYLDPIELLKRTEHRLKQEICYISQVLQESDMLKTLSQIESDITISIDCEDFNDITIPINTILDISTFYNFPHVMDLALEMNSNFDVKHALIAFSQNHIDLVHWILEKHFIQPNDALFSLACQKGCLSVIKTCVKYLPVQYHHLYLCMKTRQIVCCDYLVTQHNQYENVLKSSIALGDIFYFEKYYCHPQYEDRVLFDAENAIEHAIELGFTSIAEFLFIHEKKLENRHHEFFLLKVCAKFGSAQLLKNIFGSMQLDADCLADAIQESKGSFDDPLFIATVHGHERVVTYLLEMVGLYTPKDLFQIENILYVAAKHGHTKILRYLLEDYLVSKFVTENDGIDINRILDSQWRGKTLLETCGNVESKKYIQTLIREMKEEAQLLGLGNS